MDQSPNNQSADSAIDQLRDLVEETILAPPRFMSGAGYFKDVPIFKTIEELIAAAPGSEKSKFATEIANRLWKEQRESTLYLMLSHDAIRDRLRFIRQDGMADVWRHYEGHRPGCPVRSASNNGYTGARCECNRKHPTIEWDKPTLAALNVLLHNDLTDQPTHPDLELFRLWIIDEIDFGAFVGEFSATSRDLGSVSSGHPLESVKKLATGIRRLISLQEEEALPSKLNGLELYKALDDALGLTSTSVKDLMEKLRPLEYQIVTHRWSETSFSPRNFPPYLVPIFCEEAEDYLESRDFNPRIHIVSQGNRRPLQIRWRRKAHETMQFVNNLLILDASADIALLKKAFADTRIRQSITPTLPPWPENVIVHQWADSTVTKTELGFRYHDDETGFDEASLEIWVERIRVSLDGLDRKLSVGVVTHLALEESITSRIRTWGFETVESLHFHNVRGSNQFEKFHVLVLLGCPIPNMAGFEEEAQAFFFDDHVLDLARKRKPLSLNMREGRQFPVNVYGYWAPPASSYYNQKCQGELYQAIHRIRPNISQDYPRQVFLFTNMPVDGVVVDKVLVDESSFNFQIASRIRRLLDDQSMVSIREVAELVATGGQTIRSLERKIKNHCKEIEILARAQYCPGTRGRGGTANRFVKMDKP